MLLHGTATTGERVAIAFKSIVALVLVDHKYTRVYISSDVYWDIRNDFDTCIRYYSDWMHSCQRDIP